MSPTYQHNDAIDIAAVGAPLVHKLITVVLTENRERYRYLLLLLRLIFMESVALQNLYSNPTSLTALNLSV